MAKKLQGVAALSHKRFHDDVAGGCLLLKSSITEREGVKRKKEPLVGYRLASQPASQPSNHERNQPRNQNRRVVVAVQQQQQQLMKTRCNSNYSTFVGCDCSAGFCILCSKLRDNKETAFVYSVMLNKRKLSHSLLGS